MPNDENRNAESLISAEEDGSSKYFQQKDQELESIRLMLATHTKEFNDKRQSLVSSVEEELGEGTLLKVTELETNFGKLLGISQLLMERSD